MNCVRLRELICLAKNADHRETAEEQLITSNLHQCSLLVHLFNDDSSAAYVIYMYIYQLRGRFRNTSRKILKENSTICFRQYSRICSEGVRETTGYLCKGGRPAGKE